MVDEKLFSQAKNIVKGSGVNIVCSRRLVGGVIGNVSGRKAYVDERIKQWRFDLEHLSMEFYLVSYSKLPVTV